MTYIPYLGTFFFHGTPVWPWPVIGGVVLAVPCRVPQNIDIRHISIMIFLFDHIVAISSS